jgi:ATP-dependent Clp protease ATP-binding subunit ClpA
MQAVVVDRQIGREQAARAEARRKANPYSVVERYTQSVRKAILHARSESLGRNQSIITVADLLAGLCEQEDTRAERIGELKDNAQYLRWFAGLPQLPCPEPAPLADEKAARCELDPEARRALTFAVMEADLDHQHWIDSDHLLRGLLRFPNRAQFAVLKTELNLRSARLASFDDRDRYAPEEQPQLTMMETFIQKHMRQWAPPVLSAVCYLYILLQSMGLRLIPAIR